jgi:hypothetical protein
MDIQVLQLVIQHGVPDFVSAITAFNSCKLVRSAFVGFWVDGLEYCPPLYVKDLAMWAAIQQVVVYDLNRFAVKQGDSDFSNHQVYTLRFLQLLYAFNHVKLAWDIYYDAVHELFDSSSDWLDRETVAMNGRCDLFKLFGPEDFNEIKIRQFVPLYSSALLDECEMWKFLTMRPGSAAASVVAFTSKVIEARSMVAFRWVEQKMQLPFRINFAHPWSRQNPNGWPSFVCYIIATREIMRPQLEQLQESAARWGNGEVMRLVREMCTGLNISKPY